MDLSLAGYSFAPLLSVGCYDDDVTMTLAFSPFLINIDSLSNRHIRLTGLADVFIKPLPNNSIFITELEPSALPKLNGFKSVSHIYSSLDLVLLSKPFDEGL